MDKRGEVVFPAEDCTRECEVGYHYLIHRCTVGLLEEYDEGLMLGGQMLNDMDLAGSDALDVQMQNTGSMVLFNSASTAMP